MESIRNWTVHDAGTFLTRVVIVALVWYGLWRIPQDGLGALLDASTPGWLVVVLVNTSVIAYLVVRSRWTGVKLAGALIVFYSGLQTVSFVEIYLYGMIPLEAAVQWTATSLATVVGVTAVTLVVFGRLTGPDSPPPDDRLRLSVWQWVWKTPLIAVIHLLTFLAAGLFVFMGVAELVDPVALAEYEILDPPSWIFPFQALRGIIFAGLMLPVVYLFAGGLRETQVTVALAFAVLLSSGLLLPDSGLPGLLWVAHAAEVFSSSFVLGLIVVPLVHHQHHPLRWLAQRTVKRDGGKSVT